MTVSKEVQDAVKRIRDDNDLISSLRAASALQAQQLADIQSKYNALMAAPAASTLSDEDRFALEQALNDARDTHDELADAVPANTAPQTDGGAPAAVQTGPASSAGDAGEINGPSANDGGAPSPLMPTSAFDPAGGNKPVAADAGQPQQPRAIETPGGFVIAGGGGTSRAVGSMPDSPSSSIVVPADPDAKAPANNADLVKSGFGDASQNAATDSEGRTAEQIVAAQTAAQPAPETVQAQQDALAKEKEAREANPLNLAPAGTPQAGSADADKQSGQRLNQDGSVPGAPDPDGKPAEGAGPGDPNAPPPPPSNPAP